MTGKLNLLLFGASAIATVILGVVQIQDSRNGRKKLNPADLNAITNAIKETKEEK